MTIRNRLTIQFTLITGIILLLVFSAIYIVLVKVTRNEFFDRLRERATIAENIYFEEDELTKSIYEQFQEKFLSKLPDEMVQIFDEKNELLHIEGIKISLEKKLLSVYSVEQIGEIRKKGTYRFSVKNSDASGFSFGDPVTQVIGEYYHDNQGDFVIFVSAQDIYGNQRLIKLLGALAITYIFALAVMFFSGRFYARNALKPITRVVHRVQKISASNLHLRVDLERNNDEIAELSVTFNNMLTRLESSFEEQKTFVSNASHELRTPLTSIIGELEVFLSKERTPAEYKEAMQSVLNDAQQMNELITGLLNIAQIGFNESEIQFEEFRLDELLTEIEKEITVQNPAAKILSDFINLPEDASKLVLNGNKRLLSIAIFNILHNAIKFSNNSPVNCNLRYMNDQIELRIIDKGIGIPGDEIAKVFQPFYRSQSARNYPGHGVGLSLVEKILQLHQIKISIQSEQGKGTEVLLVFKQEQH